MPITKQRILQAGVVALAMTMLGGYVVYSQRAQQPQQIAQSSKGRVGFNGFVEGTNTRGTNPAMPVAGMVFLNAAGRPVATSTVPVAVITTGNVSKVMMGGSKFVTVVKTDQVVTTLAPTSPTNPSSRAFMPGSKSFFIRSPIDSPTGASRTTNAVVSPPHLK